MNCLTFARRASAAVALAALGTTAMADEVNVYSSRHYDSDDALYAKFTEQTGITVNLITDICYALADPRVRLE